MMDWKPDRVVFSFLLSLPSKELRGPLPPMICMAAAVAIRIYLHFFHSYCFGPNKYSLTTEHIYFDYNFGLNMPLSSTIIAPCFTTVLRSLTYIKQHVLPVLPYIYSVHIAPQAMVVGIIGAGRNMS